MKDKRRILYIIIIFLIIVASIVLISLGIIWNKKTEKPTITTPSVKEIVKEKEQINYQEEEKTKVEETPYNNLLPEYRNQYGNPYIMGRLEIPNLNIDTFVTRYINNEYYLDYNIYNQKDGIGVPFFDFRNTDLQNSRQINIYGHNTTNPNIRGQLPFTNLEAFLDQNIFNNYKDAYLSTDDGIMKYKLVATKIITESNNEHMKLIFLTDNNYHLHLEKLLNDTMYLDTSTSITEKDAILVLQVCNYNPPNTFLLVIYKKVS